MADDFNFGANRFIRQQIIKIVFEVSGLLVKRLAPVIGIEENILVEFEARVLGKGGNKRLI